MQAAEKKLLMIARLTQAFQPDALDVIDESDQHVVHAVHQGCGRLFAIIISAKALSEMTRVASHRKIYDLFSDLMPDEIHALRIQVCSAAISQSPMP